MPITLNDLTVNFDHLDRQDLLTDWVWLIGFEKTPILITALGDVFVQDSDDRGIYLLSAGPGEVEKVCDTVEEFTKLLADTDFVVEHFVPKVVVELRSMDRVLAPGELYGYVVAPVLGGEYSVDNLEATDIEVHFTMLGQIHDKARSLPEGTVIDSVRFEAP